MSESEIFAVAGILPLMERYNNTPVKDTIKKVYENISEMLPNQVEVKSSFMDDVKFISNPLPIIDEEIFNQVFKAMKLHKIIRFDYRSIKETSYKKHELHPYKICNQKDDWYILGFSPEHGKFKTFSLARMKNIEFEEDFTPDPDYKKKDSHRSEFLNLAQKTKMSPTPRRFCLLEFRVKPDSAGSVLGS